MIPTSIKNLGYLIAAILGIQYDAVAAFGLLMIFDVFTGILASAKVNGVRSITSKRLAFGVISKLLLLLIPLSIALAGRAVGQDFLSVVHSAIFVLAVAEAYSIIGNIYTVKSGERVPEFDAISVVLKKVRIILESLSK